MIGQHPVHAFTSPKFECSIGIERCVGVDDLQGGGTIKHYRVTEESNVKSHIYGLKTGVFQPDVRAANQEIQRLERVDQSSLQKYQDAIAMALVLRAFDSSPFYRDLYTSKGYSRKDLLDRESFSSLPLLEKNDLREYRDEIIIAGTARRRLLPSATGGSTGKPLQVFHDAAAPTAAMWWSFYRWWGLDPSIDTAFVQRERRTTVQRIRETLKWWPTSRIFLDSRNIDSSSIEKFLAQCRKLKSPFLTGYVGGILEFAQFMNNSGQAIEGLRAVGVTAAPLTASVRSFISDAFGVPVYDQYRSAEIPWIAGQCKELGGLHVLASHRRVEILPSKEASTGEDTNNMGEIVVTDLANQVFPLIRYRIGDRSAFTGTPCLCGRSFPTILPIQGRVTDTLRLPNGQAITGGLTGLFNKFPEAVTQFQIHQLNDASIDLRCVPGRSLDAMKEMKAAQEQLQQIVRYSVPVRLVVVDELKHDKGKSRIVRSDLIQKGPL